MESDAAETQAEMEAMEERVVVRLRGVRWRMATGTWTERLRGFTLDLKYGSMSDVLRNSEVMSVRSCRGLDFAFELKGRSMSELFGNLGTIFVTFCRAFNFGYPRGLKGRWSSEATLFAAAATSDVASWNKDVASVTRAGAAEVILDSMDFATLFAVDIAPGISDVREEIFDSMDFATLFAVEMAPGISEVREAMNEVALLAPLAMSEQTS